MTHQSEFLWKSIFPLLQRFAEQISAKEPAIKSTIGKSSNDTFLLRCYVGFGKLDSDEEISITVDASLDKGMLMLTSDLCSDNGEVIADGPNSNLIPLVDKLSTESIAAWLQNFDAFLDRTRNVALLHLRS
jgi:hypothetical protein